MKKHTVYSLLKRERCIVRFITAKANFILFFFKTYKSELLGFTSAPFNSNLFSFKRAKAYC